MLGGGQIAISFVNYIFPGVGGTFKGLMIGAYHDSVCVLEGHPDFIGEWENGVGRPAKSLWQ